MDLPDGQGVQEVAPPSEYSPATQFTGLAGLLQCVPARQGEHWDAPPAEYDPAEQASSAAAPDGQYLPAEQVEQVVAAIVMDKMY